MSTDVVVAEVLVTMRCPRCGELKPANHFTRDRTKKSGYHGLCKLCNYRRLKDKLATDHYKNYRKDWELRHRYGLSPAAYRQLFRDQDNQCAICGASTRKLVVDHDHATGQVRALLCVACNGVLGLARDNPDVLIAALNYLEKFRSVDHQPAVDADHS